jgi:hypothetical protein
MEVWRTEQIPQELLDLRSELELLSPQVRSRVLALWDRAANSAQLQNRLVKMAQEAVDELRLDVKYLLFDLRATRNERDGYRQQLTEMSEDNS